MPSRQHMFYKFTSENVRRILITPKTKFTSSSMWPNYGRVCLFGEENTYYVLTKKHTSLVSMQKPQFMKTVYRYNMFLFTVRYEYIYIYIYIYIYNPIAISLRWVTESILQGLFITYFSNSVKKKRINTEFE